MSTLLKLLFTVICLFLVFFNVNAQEIGKYVEQYEGQVGVRTVRVKLLRIGEKSNEEVLIQVSGVDDPLDGHIYKYKKEWQTSDKSLNKYIYVTTQIPGSERYSLFHSDEYYGYQILKIFLMDAPMEAITVYPATYQKDLDPGFMYKQYLQQRKEAAVK